MSFVYAAANGTLKLVSFLIHRKILKTTTGRRISWLTMMSKAAKHQKGQKVVLQDQST